MTSILSRNAAFTAHTRPTTGDTKTTFVSTDHLGWLMCDGRPLDTTAYNLLFQVIGYTYGGAGAVFNLPDMRGRVMGSNGTIVEASGTWNFPNGTKTGEVQHKLTIPEMPSHNHDTGSPPSATTAQGNTTTNGAHIHGITDPGHTHSYFNQPNTANPAVSLTTMDVADNVNVNQTTGSSTTGITINTAGAHNHQINSNGGDQYHNNMQPTIFYGNTFIYCGIPIRGTWPMPTPQVNPYLI